ncbi:MAG: hypothetical protein FJ087_10945 [Deltaproteobacteria bacterium]|nr:hypothetical protein [Deltaproteobacteria bacterium]
MGEHVRRKRYAGKCPRRYEDRYKEHDAGRWPEVSERVRANARASSAKLRWAVRA